MSGYYTRRGPRMFKPGDLVRIIYGKDTSVGVIESFERVKKLYEWWETYAIIRFSDGRKEMHQRSNLILDERANLYDSLKPGDLITRGIKNPSQAVVISCKPRRGYLTAVRNSVAILEYGQIRRLDPTQYVKKLTDDD